MPDHIATLEGMLLNIEELIAMGCPDIVEPPLAERAEALRAAIALMRGQSEIVAWQVRLIDVKTGKVVHDWHNTTKQAYDAVGGAAHQGSQLRCEYRVLNAPPAAKQERDDA